MPLSSGKEPLNQRAPVVATQWTPIVRSGFPMVPSMWRHYLDASLLWFSVPLLLIIRSVTTQVLRIGFNHVQVKTQRQQTELVMIRPMGSHCQGQPVAIHNAHDFYALTAIGLVNPVIAARCRRKRSIEKAFRFIQRPFVAQRVGKIYRNFVRDFAAPLVLKTPMNRLVLRVVVRELSLSARIENRANGPEKLVGRNRLGTRSTGGELFPDPFRLFVAYS